MSQGRCRLYVLTNATVDLLDYIKLVIDWPLATTIPIASSNLYTLPAFMGGASSVDKTVDCVFTCMHFKDYSKERQNDLQELKRLLGDRLVLSGDVEGLVYDGKQVESVVTDTKDVWQWYKNAKTTPVLLEPNYARFGVLPNRIAEAIACKCIPIVHVHSVEELDNYDCTVLQIPFVIATDAYELADTIDMYCKAYDMCNVNRLVDNCSTQLKEDMSAFVLQLATLLSK